MSELPARDAVRQKHLQWFALSRLPHKDVCLALYMRAMMLCCMLIAQALIWICDVRQLFYPRLGVEFGFIALLRLGLPVAFILLMVAVRTVPRLIVPKLVLRNFGTVTTLDLTRDD